MLKAESFFVFFLQLSIEQKQSKYIYLARLKMSVPEILFNASCCECINYGTILERLNGNCDDKLRTINPRSFSLLQANDYFY